MFVYKNDKGAIVHTACKITGGGWTLVEEPEVKKETRAEEPKATKPKRKKNE